MSLRVRRGDQKRPLTARDRNALADAADRAARPPVASPVHVPDPSLLNVSNDTSSEIPARSVVGLVEPAVATLASHADGIGQIPTEFETRWRNRLEWTGDDSDPFDFGKYWNRYAITTRHANPGALTPAVWRGRVIIDLTVRNRRHTHAEPDPDDREKMRTAWHGTPILWSETLSASEITDVDAGTPVEKLAELWLDPQPGICVTGYLDGGLTPATVSSGDLVPTTATLRVWTDHADDGWSKSGTNADATVEITNRDESLDVDAGIYMRARSDGVIWEPDWISCVPSLVDRT
jgi:hypothetical protein